MSQEPPSASLVANPILRYLGEDGLEVAPHVEGQVAREGHGGKVGHVVRSY